MINKKNILLSILFVSYVYGSVDSGELVLINDGFFQYCEKNISLQDIIRISLVSKRVLDFHNTQWRTKKIEYHQYWYSVHKSILAGKTNEFGILCQLSKIPEILTCFDQSFNNILNTRIKHRKYNVDNNLDIISETWEKAFNVLSNSFTGFIQIALDSTVIFEKENNIPLSTFFQGNEKFLSYFLDKKIFNFSDGILSITYQKDVSKITLFHLPDSYRDDFALGLDKIEGKYALSIAVHHIPIVVKLFKNNKNIKKLFCIFFRHQELSKLDIENLPSLMPIIQNTAVIITDKLLNNVREFLLTSPQYIPHCFVLHEEQILPIDCFYIKQDIQGKQYFKQDLIRYSSKNVYLDFLLALSSDARDLHNYLQMINRINNYFLLLTQNHLIDIKKTKKIIKIFTDRDYSMCNISIKLLIYLFHAYKSNDNLDVFFQFFETFETNNQLKKNIKSVIYEDGYETHLENSYIDDHHALVEWLLEKKIINPTTIFNDLLKRFFCNFFADNECVGYCTGIRITDTAGFKLICHGLIHILDNYRECIDCINFIVKPDFFNFPHYYGPSFKERSESLKIYAKKNKEIHSLIRYIYEEILQKIEIPNAQAKSTKYVLDAVKETYMTINPTPINNIKITVLKHNQFFNRYRRGYILSFFAVILLLLYKNHTHITNYIKQKIGKKNINFS